MDLKNKDEYTECVVICTPNQYLNSLYYSSSVGEDMPNCSNTLVMNEETGFKIGLCGRPRLYHMVSLTFKFKGNQHDLINDKICCKRLVNLVLDQSVSDNKIVLSEDLLFNIHKNIDQYLKIEKIWIRMSNMSSQGIILSPKATKIVISSYQQDAPLNTNVIDNFLKRYFSSSKLLYLNDVFSIETNNVLTFNNSILPSILYFKVIDIESSSDGSEANEDYIVDSSVMMYQGPNWQGFLPQRYLSLCHKPCFYSLMNNTPLLDEIVTNAHSLIPFGFHEIFNKLCNCVRPFLFNSHTVQDLGLSPILLLTGPSGSGKSMLVEATSQRFGVRYMRVDCVTVGGAAPGLGEAKLKAVFDQLKKLSPCILQLSDIEALCQDADFKEDIRVMNFFEDQLRMSKFEYPVVIVGSSESVKSISSSLSQLFLEHITLSTPSLVQRESIIQWMYWYNSEELVKPVLQEVASQTSGFVFRDLQVLVSLAFKERFNRSKGDATEHITCDMQDFNKIIEIMHRAYSEAIGAPTVPKVIWNDVGGLEQLKKEIIRSLRSNMFNSGLKRSGLLLHGPPGTGKTLLAKAVANQCGRNFLSVKGPELLNMYVGQSEHNVRDLFQLAKAASPCIIFFDELDSLAPNRGRSGDSGGVMDRVVSQMLAEMDDVGESIDVFILGATNRPDLIDPALIRPGRLDKLLYVGPCEDKNSKLNVLSALTRSLCLDADVDLEEIVSLLPSSVTGAQLSAMCSTAWLSSARNIISSREVDLTAKVTVKKDYFITAIRSFWR